MRKARGAVEAEFGRGVSRRAFLVGGAAFAAVLADLPSALARRGWLEVARAAEPDLTRDTYNGLVAFIVPGPDPYSVAQGQATKEPGGIAAGAPQALIDFFEKTAPPLPTAAMFATLLNETALEVNPAAANGGFVSPFARLRFAEKADVFKRLESDPVIGQTVAGYVVHELPLLTAYISYSEAGVFDPKTRTLTARPVGWDLTSYRGVVEGNDELIGYWRGVRQTKTSSSYSRGKGA